jgi:5,10-methenyltetrahydromethanopterin hydrogenase
LERFISEKNYDEALKEVGRIVQLILKFVESVVIEGAEKFKVNDHLRKHGIIESTPEKIMLRIKEEVKEIGKEIEDSIGKKDKEKAKSELLNELIRGNRER